MAIEKKETVSMRTRDEKVMWHPYTPMKVWNEAIPIVKGEGVYLTDDAGKRYIDAVSSWWVNIHGHAHPYIAQKIFEQLNTLEHCIFAGFTHEPAITLAERLLDILPGPQHKIFYSDNGSTAVEVALKMALQYWKNNGEHRNRIIALEHAYHGDTFGAMAVSARSIFTDAFADLLFDVAFVPFPNESEQLDSYEAMEQLLSKGDVAAFIVEPLLQGSGGMNMYPPAVLDRYFKLCKQYGTLVIADEVMTGFGRTGTLFACDRVETKPDMICLSKGLTGGTLPMGITACTDKIFEAFYDDDRSKMLYHGHSFTANPVGCAAALASLDLLLNESCTASRKMIEDCHIGFTAQLKQSAKVANIRICGTIIAMDVLTEDPHYHSSLRDKMYRYFLEKGILLRPLGHVLYILPPYCITKAELQYVYDTILEMLDTLL